MLISIVCNFYKSGRFIPRLVESIARQTYTDWQMVCVIDASPGNDERVLRRQVKRLGIADRTDIIINPENLGLSRSKQVGIKACRGDYITFIDGDDFLAPEALERLATPAIEHDVDLVCMNHYRHFPLINRNDEYRIGRKDFPYDRRLERKEFFDTCFLTFFGPAFISFPFWGKLYRRSLFDRLAFDFPAKGNTFAEDKWFNYHMFQIIDSAWFVDYAGYYWRWGGISSNRTHVEWTERKLIDDIIDHHSMLTDDIERYDYGKAVLPYRLFRRDRLVEYLCTRAAPRPGSADTRKVVDDVRAVLAKECFADIAFVTDNDPQHMVDIIGCLQSGDIEKAYARAHEHYASQWRLRLIQLIGDHIINPIRHIN